MTTHGKETPRMGGLEKIRQHQRLVQQMGRLQGLLRDLVSTRLQQDIENGETLSEVAGRLNGNWTDLNRFANTGRPITHRSKMLRPLIEYARTSTKAAGLTAEQRSSLRDAERLFAAFSGQLRERAYLLSQAPEQVLWLACDVQEALEKLAPGIPPLIFAQGFGEQADLVAGLIEIKAEAIIRLQDKAEAERLLNQLSDGETLRKRIQAAQDQMRATLDTWNTRTERLCKDLLPTYRDFSGISRALGARRGYLRETLTGRVGRLSLEQARRVFLQVADLTRKHELPLSAEALTWIAEAEASQPRPEPAETDLIAEEADETAPADAPDDGPDTRETPPPPRPLLEEHGLANPPPPSEPPPRDIPHRQEAEATCDPRGLLALMGTDLLYEELRRRGETIDPTPTTPPDTAAAEAVQQLGQHLLGGMEIVIVGLELVSQVAPNAFGRTDRIDLVRKALQLYALSGADTDPSIATEQRDGQGSLSFEQAFGKNGKGKKG